MNKHVTPTMMVREFHEAMGAAVDAPWRLGDLEHLRYELILEEFMEFAASEDKANTVKELADLLYVIYGYAVTFGIDLDAAFRRVHLSNMSKLGPDGKPVLRADGKVMKGPNYQPPVMQDLVP